MYICGAIFLISTKVGDPSRIDIMVWHTLYLLFNIPFVIIGFIISFNLTSDCIGSSTGKMLIAYVIIKNACIGWSIVTVVIVSISYWNYRTRLPAILDDTLTGIGSGVIAK